MQGQYAILIRGTVDKAGSIIDDLLSVMIPANDQIGFTLDNHSFSIDYQLAETNNTKGGVHLGFTLAMFFLMWDPDSGILGQLFALPQGSDAFIDLQIREWLDVLKKHGRALDPSRFPL